MTRRQRVLTELDREIERTTRHLEDLRTARKAMARTVGPEGRKGRTPAVGPDNSLEALVLALMGDGRIHNVASVVAALQRSGVDADPITVRSLLYRGSRRSNAKFEAVRRGHYKATGTPEAPATEADNLNSRRKEQAFQQ